MAALRVLVEDPGLCQPEKDKGKNIHLKWKPPVHIDVEFLTTCKLTTRGRDKSFFRLLRNKQEGIKFRTMH
jgi:hypothetical protein